MYLVITINFVLNISFLIVESHCSATAAQCNKSRNYLHMNLSSWNGFYNCIPLMLQLIYLLPFFAYIPLFIGIFSNFKQTYKELYNEMKGRFMLYLIIIEIIILARAAVYWYIMYGEALFHISARKSRISIYFSELVVGCIIIFISYKNL
jgi:hypothetical protein